MYDEYLSGKKIGLIFLIWFSFFVYKAGPTISEIEFLNNFDQKDHWIHVSKEQHLQMKQELLLVQQEAEKSIHNNTYSPEQCARDVVRAIALNDTLQRVYPPNLVISYPTVFAHEYLRQKDPDVYTRYTAELDRILGRKPAQPIDVNWVEVALTIGGFLIQVFFCSLLVICVKRYPFSDMQARDVLAMLSYSVALFWGAAWYQRDNSITKMVDAALAHYRRQHGTEGRHKVLAYVFAFYVVTTSLFVCLINVATVAAQVATRVTSIVVSVADAPVKSEVPGRAHKLKLSVAMLERHLEELLKKMKQLFACFVGMLVVTQSLHTIPLWYVHYQPIRVVPLRWFRKARRIRAPSIVSMMSLFKSWKSNIIGGYNEIYYKYIRGVNVAFGC